MSCQSLYYKEMGKKYFIIEIIMYLFLMSGLVIVSYHQMIGLGLIIFSTFIIGDLTGRFAMYENIYKQKEKDIDANSENIK